MPGSRLLSADYTDYADFLEERVLTSLVQK